MPIWMLSSLNSFSPVLFLSFAGRSPVFSYLSASLQGLHTIRAFGMEDKCQAEFDAHQNLHSEAWFLFLSTSRWLAVRLDWLCALFVTAVTFCAVLSAGGEFIIACALLVAISELFWKCIFIRAYCYGFTISVPENHQNQ